MTALPDPIVGRWGRSQTSPLATLRQRCRLSRLGPPSVGDRGHLPVLGPPRPAALLPAEARSVGAGSATRRRDLPPRWHASRWGQTVALRGTRAEVLPSGCRHPVEEARDADAVGPARPRVSTGSAAPAAFQAVNAGRVVTARLRAHAGTLPGGEAVSAEGAPAASGALCRSGTRTAGLGSGPDSTGYGGPRPTRSA